MDYCTAIKIVDEALQRVVKREKKCSWGYLQCVCMYIWGKVWKICTSIQLVSNEYLCSFLLSPLNLTFFQIWKTSVYYFDSEKKLAISLFREKNQFGLWIDFISVWLIGCSVTGTSTPKLIYFLGLSHQFRCWAQKPWNIHTQDALILLSGCGNMSACELDLKCGTN